MKRLTLTAVLMAVLLIFAACSNEEPVLIENENSFSGSFAEESFPEEENALEDIPEEIPVTLDFSKISGTAVKSSEICAETENIPWEYAYELTEHFDRWKKLLFSQEIVEIKAADGHDTVKFGELSAEDVKSIFDFLDSFEPGLFYENSELNPHTGGALHFGAYDNEGKNLWTATFNGGWLIIRLEDDEEFIIYDVDKQNIGWPSFEFLQAEPLPEPEPSAENAASAFDELRDIYYTDPLKISVDLGSYTGNIDIGRFTPIYQTVYDYTDGADYQMFKADIKNGRTFMELTEPTEKFYAAYFDETEESTVELSLADGKYLFGMSFVNDKYKHFAMPESPELIALAGKLDLSKTECRYVRIIGYTDVILINDGANEYFYVLSTTGESVEDFSEGDLLSSAELAKKMFG